MATLMKPPCTPSYTNFYGFLTHLPTPLQQKSERPLEGLPGYGTNGICAGPEAMNQ
jgi:hypothetical protein